MPDPSSHGASGSEDGVRAVLPEEWRSLKILEAGLKNYQPAVQDSIRRHFVRLELPKPKGAGMGPAWVSQVCFAIRVGEQRRWGFFAVCSIFSAV